MEALCVDLDNVIAGSDAVMRRVIRDFTGGKVNLEEHHIREFNYHECFDDAGHHTEEKDWPEIHELFSEPRHLWLVQPYPGAVDCLRTLRARFEIHLATSRLPEARGTTIAWLENHNIPIDDVHFLRRGKKHTSLGKFAAAVEDDYEQGAAFASSGTLCYLMDRPWNHSKAPADKIKWVQDWKELCEELLRGEKAVSRRLN
jgi:5' nucleotidase, deoxy (Pyrimidine), cytosolic type C protein (NT5C)